MARRLPPCSPQIDSVTFVPSRHKISPGEVVKCRIGESDGYDLIAQPEPEVENTVSLSVMR